MERKTRNITVQFKQEYFNTRFPFDPRREQVWKPVVEWIQKRFIRPTDRVLDLGAAYCDFINHVDAAERYALDVFERLPQYARPGVVPHIGTCTRMEMFDDGALDVIFASNLLEHLTHDEMLETLAEVRRVLRPDGRLILLQPNFRYCYRTYFDDYTHLQVFTHMGMFDMLEMAEFEIERMFPRFLPVNMKSTLRLQLPFLPLIVRTYLHSPIKPRAGQMLFVARNRRSTRLDPAP